MPRLSPRALASTCACSLLLGVAACDASAPSPMEVDPLSVEGIDPSLGLAAAKYDQRGTRTVSPVYAYPNGTEPLGQSTLQRRRNSVLFRIRTEGLAPGHAYTVWMVIFNDPAGCEADDGEAVCNDFDLFNPEAQPDMVYGSGRVAPRSGKATFVGWRRVGTLRGSVNGPVGLPSNGLTNPQGADIRFIVHDHGPTTRSFMPDMVRSVDGGCTDAGVPYEGFPSPWNLYEGPRALPAYGRRGDNTCQSVQFSAHLPEN